ncbi:MAG: hypothetical protein ACJAVI_003279 [Candidatus Azotimanducaceae bacterium]|jgi:hypothetical protein
MSTSRIVIFGLIFVVSMAIAVVILQRQNQVPGNTFDTPDSNVEEYLVEEEEAVGLVTSSLVFDKGLDLDEARKRFYFDGEPYPYTVATYRYALDDLEKEFDLHYPGYLQGDAESTYKMSVIGRHCIAIFPTDPDTNMLDTDISEADVRAEFNKLTISSGSSVESLEALENAHVDALPTCIKLVNVMPAEFTQVLEFVHLLVKSSANAGNPNAKLEMLDQYIKVDYRNFKESGKLLEEVVRSREPKAYQQVIDFYGRFRDQEQDIDEYDERVPWSVLRCKVDKNCKRHVMEDVLMTEFGSVVVDEIYQRAEEIEKVISSGEKVGFMEHRRETDFAEELGQDTPAYVVQEEISWQTD